MIEFCSFRRMLITIVVFISISTAVFLLEDYYEQETSSHVVHSSQTADMPVSGVSATTKTSFSSPPAGESSDCWQRESFRPIALCLPCSDFELKALAAAHCKTSGFYDQLNCTQSGALGLRPCLTRGVYAETRFNGFWAVMAGLTAVSAGVVQWRQQLLDRRAYARVQQQLGGGV